MTTRARCPRAARPSSRPPGWPGSPVASTSARTLLLGEGESQRSGRRRPSLLASSFEALTGALYLDLGYELVRRLAASTSPTPSWRSRRPSSRSRARRAACRNTRNGDPASDPSTGSLEATGPDHEKSFRVEVWVDGESLGVGEGPSRRIAETAAAAQAIERIRAERAAERAAARDPTRRGPSDPRRADRRERQRRPA